MRIVSSTTGPEEAGVEPVFAADEAATRIEGLKRLVREVMVAPANRAVRGADGPRDPARQFARILGAAALRCPGRNGQSLRQLRRESARRPGLDPRRQGARACSTARANIAYEDIDAVCAAALDHRIMLNYAAHSDNVEASRYRRTRQSRRCAPARLRVGHRRCSQARAFEPEFFRPLDGLVLGTRRSRTLRAGQRTLGRVQGLGIEPENFSEYTDGDDLALSRLERFARLDDLTIRTFRAERQIEITILVDASASMGLPRDDDKLGLATPARRRPRLSSAMSENDPVRIGAFAASPGGP